MVAPPGPKNRDVMGELCICNKCQTIQKQHQVWTLPRKEHYWSVHVPQKMFVYIHGTILNPFLNIGWFRAKVPWACNPQVVTHVWEIMCVFCWQTRPHMQKAWQGRWTSGRRMTRAPWETWPTHLCTPMCMTTGIGLPLLTLRWVLSLNSHSHCEYPSLMTVWQLCKLSYHYSSLWL